jgi:hypothetical protein
MGLSTDAINRLGLEPDKAKALLDSMPIAYAVSYMFGTVGSAIVIAVVGPKLLGINLEAACKDYEEKQGGGTKEIGGAGSALAPLGNSRLPCSSRWESRRPACDRGRGARARRARLHSAHPPRRKDRGGRCRHRPA